MPRYSQQEIAVDSEKTRSSVEPRQSHNFAKKNGKINLTEFNAI